MNATLKRIGLVYTAGLQCKFVINDQTISEVSVMMMTVVFVTNYKA